MFSNFSSFILGEFICVFVANIADPDQTPPIEQSDLCLHCLFVNQKDHVQILRVKWCTF